MPQNIFVLGLDARNQTALDALPGADQYVFHGVLDIATMQSGRLSFATMLNQAQDQLDAFDGTIDAIVGYWDFPVNLLVPILCRRYGLPSKQLEAVLKCEHKYWSRLIQQQVIDECPAFGLIDIHDQIVTLPEHMSYPVWIKPIQSFASQGAHYAGNAEQLARAVTIERAEGHSFGEAFDEVLQHVDLPAEVAGIPGDAYMVEQAVTGQQCTLEGYSWNGHVEIIGVVDSILYEDSPSFLRYQYPSRLPEHALAQMAQSTRTVIDAIGLQNSTFNIEYFWDDDTQQLALLEINSRHSQSHSEVFYWVDGMPNHLAMVELAMGRVPQMPQGKGDYAVAAKWMLRTFTDGFVHRVPTRAEVLAVEQQFADVTIKIVAQEGIHLSDMTGQDSYSYLLAEIFVGANTDDQLRQIYDDCREALRFIIGDLPMVQDSRN